MDYNWLVDGILKNSQPYDTSKDSHAGASGSKRGRKSNLEKMRMLGRKRGFRREGSREEGAYGSCESRREKKKRAKNGDYANQQREKLGDGRRLEGEMLKNSEQNRLF